MDFWTRNCIESSNAYQSGKICYTEDHIPVYNIFILRIPKCINKEDLKKHFSGFGEIVSASIIQKKNRMANRYAFVNYKSAKSAAKALKSDQHFIKGKQLLVKAADSWNQPKSIKNENDDVNNEEIPTDSILNLNDDCLLHIFSFLSLKEQLSMSNVCKRFQSIFEIVIKIGKKLNINENEYLTLMEVRQIVMKAGHYIENISLNAKKIPEHYKRVIEFLPNYCQNLQTLHLQSIDIVHTETFKRISNNMKKLKQLEFIDCEIEDEAFLYLSNLPMIEKLNVTRNYDLSGKYLCKFKNLQILSLKECDQLSSKYFIELCETVHGLKDLNIKGCFNLNQKALDSMVNNLLELEQLTMSTENQINNYDKLSEIKNLKSLTIFCKDFVSEIGDELFIKLSMRNEHVLEYLGICGSVLNENIMDAIKLITSLRELCLRCDSYVDDDFLKECTEIKSLKYLDVAGSLSVTKYGIEYLFINLESLETINISLCKQFYSDLIYSIIDIIKEKRRYELYTVIVAETNIPTSILNDPKYLEVKDYLRILFEFDEAEFQIVSTWHSDSDIYDDDYFDSPDELYDSDDDGYRCNYDPDYADEDYHEYMYADDDFPLMWS